MVPDMSVLRSQVLIDTWWNVNVAVRSNDGKFGIVLIDTWWNVNNCPHYNAFHLVQCFNRYMVECEY